MVVGTKSDTLTAALGLGLAATHALGHTMLAATLVLVVVLSRLGSAHITLVPLALHPALFTIIFHAFNYSTGVKNFGKY